MTHSQRRAHGAVIGLFEWNELAFSSDRSYQINFQSELNLARSCGRAGDCAGRAGGFVPEWQM